MDPIEVLTSAEDQARASLKKLGLARPGEVVPLTALSGGVSCDVFRADLPGGPVCVKRALPKLRTAQDWRAPVARSASETAWLRLAEQAPGVRAPRVLAEDAEAGLFVMTWFPPEQHRLWKSELAAGRVDVRFAAEVGAALGRMHAFTAGQPAVAERFDVAALFLALRVDPFLLAVARAHPDLAPRLEPLAERTLAARIALAHGDVSPKNILVGPDGPVFLDAECAWYGDPAFDLAFVSAHLLLKAVWVPPHAAEYLAALQALTAAYFAEATWEARAGLDARAAELLGALLLARVDGKSPVEYLTEPDRGFVRATARGLVASPSASVDELASAWSGALERR